MFTTNSTLRILSVFDWLKLVGFDWLRWVVIDALRLLRCDALRARMERNGWAPDWPGAPQKPPDRFPLMTELNRTINSLFDRIEASQKERLEARLGVKGAAKATAALEQRLGPRTKRTEPAKPN